MISWLRQRWFLIGLVMAVGFGIMAPRVLDAAAFELLTENTILRYTLVASVLFVMALPLQPKSIWTTLSRPTAPLLAITLNIGVLPLVAWATSLLLDSTMAQGLMIAAATPCTLASAAVWTRRAGGNDAVALLVTVLTNFFCFAVTPFWVWLTTGGRGTEISLSQMTAKLAIIVVLPMVLAQLLRLRKGLGEWATDNKKRLSTLAQCGILCMVMIGSVRMGQTIVDAPTGDGDAVSLSWLSVGKMLIAVSFVHTVIWFAGINIGRGIGLRREDWIAVGFAGSQKTLMIGLQMAIDCGFTILPMVCFHITQLLIDTLLADWLAKRE